MYTRSRSKAPLDDCQAIVKAMYHHRSAMRSRCPASTRSLVRRIVATGGLLITRRSRSARRRALWIVTVPTGNFGDIFAGYAAKRMGLPIRWLRIAANVNDILPRTLKTGIYEVRGRARTMRQPRCDIQISSISSGCCSRQAAAMRLPYAADGAAKAVRTLRAAGCRCWPAIREAFTPAAADGNRDRSRHPRRLARRPAISSLPTPRLALAVADPRHFGFKKIPNIVLSTAHPAKFPDAVEAACGVRPQLPAWLDG